MIISHVNVSRFEDPDHIKWAKAVKERDFYECQICGQSGGYLNSHHKNSYDIFVKDRFNVDNGVTLCQKHHNMFHSIYGNTTNTKYQFEEFEKMCQKISSIVVN